MPDVSDNKNAPALSGERQRKPPEDKYLFRLQGRSGDGWQLRLPARMPQGALTHFFADTAYGGADAAKAAAKAMRDRMFERAGEPLHAKGRNKASRSRKLQGLPVGLSFDYKRLANGGGRAFRWLAVWQENGKHCKKTFSVEKYGFERALELAVALRHEKAGTLPTKEEMAAAMALKARPPTDSPKKLSS